MKIEEYLRMLVDKEGSDLHLKVGRPPLMRLKGDLMPTEGIPEISNDEMKDILYPILTKMRIEKLEEELELDFSYIIDGLARFRGNIFYQMGNLGAVFRVIPIDILTIEQLRLPDVLNDIIKQKSGIILITGPTGSGKSTTLAAMINKINETSHKHIMTIEDPVEFVHQDKKCTINQREVGADTFSFGNALKRALRQDPDIILVGEMRDPETISIAMTAAETGHLVFSTLHTLDAKKSIDRIIDTFRHEHQHQVRMQLGSALVAIVSQRLIKSSYDKDMLAVVEIMINTPTIKKYIQEAKVGMIDKIIADSALFYKMQTQNQHLFKLVEEGRISKENALNISNNQNDLGIMFQTQTMTPKKRKKDKPSGNPDGILGKRSSPFGSTIPPEQESE
ncbi:twitching mobility protein [bacterium BMS3Abin09]|nr:twitching mobility protein [bacterium BMS3Abin09]